MNTVSYTHLSYEYSAYSNMKLSFDLSPEHRSLIISNKDSEKRLASLNDLKIYASTRDTTSQPSLLSILRKSKLTFPTVKRFFFKFS